MPAPAYKAITALTTLVLASMRGDDYGVAVDVHDSTQAPAGTTKKFLWDDLRKIILGGGTGFTAATALLAGAATVVSLLVGSDPGGSTPLRTGGSAYIAGQLGVGTDTLTRVGILWGGSANAGVSGAAIGINSGGTVVAAANGDLLIGLNSSLVMTPGSFTGISARGLNISAFSVASFTSPGTPAGIVIGVVTGKAGADTHGLRINPPVGGDSNYLIAHGSSAATFNVNSSGTITTAAAGNFGGVVTSSVNNAIGFDANSAGVSKAGYRWSTNSSTRWDVVVPSASTALSWQAGGSSEVMSLTSAGSLTVIGAGPTSVILGVDGSVNGGLKLWNASASARDGNIYGDATYSIRLDTNSNARPIRIDGSALSISSPTSHLAKVSILPNVTGETFVIAHDGGGTYIGMESNHNLRFITNNTLAATVSTAQVWTFASSITSGNHTITGGSGTNVELILDQSGIAGWHLLNTATSGVLAINDGGSTWLSIAKTTGATTLNGAVAFGGIATFATTVNATGNFVAIGDSAGIFRVKNTALTDIGTFSTVKGWIGAGSVTDGAIGVTTLLNFYTGGTGTIALQLRGASSPVVSVHTGAILAISNSANDNSANLQNTGGAGSDALTITTSSVTVSSGVFASPSGTALLLNAPGAATATIRTNGSDALVASSAQAVRMPHYVAGTATFDASGNITSVSDERHKTNVRPFERGLAALLRLSPITHRYNELSGLDREHEYTGFSAQNVRDHIPEAVFENAETGILSFADRPVLAAVVNAMKEIDMRLTTLEQPVH